MLKTPLVVVLAFLLSCQSSTQEKDSAKKEVSTTAGREQENQDFQNSQVQHIVQRTHPFSTPQRPDYFRLALHGPSIAEGEVAFTITTYDGKKIFEENFSAADLEASMVYEGASGTPSNNEREAYIIKRMDEFVQPSDFVTPAIAPTAEVETSFVQEDVWKRIQANPEAIGFKYLIGKEDGRLLVYDPEQKKVVRYGGFGG